MRVSFVFFTALLGILPSAQPASTTGSGVTSGCIYKSYGITYGSFGSALPEAIKHRDSVLKAYDGLKQFHVSTKIVQGDKIVELITYCLNDTLPSDKDNALTDGVYPLFTRPIITSQKLIFKLKGKKIKSCMVRMRQFRRKNLRGNYVLTLETPIRSLYLLEGKSQKTLVASGCGLCVVSQCPEFTGMYSLTGIRIYPKQKKKLTTVLHDLGIDKTGWQIVQRRGVSVLPFWDLP